MEATTSRYNGTTPHGWILMKKRFEVSGISPVYMWNVWIPTQNRYPVTF